MGDGHAVVEGLRTRLAGARRSAAFVEELGARVHQLVAGMVDGRVLPKAEADALRTAIVELVRSEALPKFAGSNPDDALRILDKLKAYGWAQLEGERAALEAARASKFPPPAAATWPELAELRALAARHPDVCTIAAPVDSVYFARELEDDGLLLPEDLLALYAFADGFDLSRLGDPKGGPVFSLLPSAGIEVSDEEAGYPRRAAVFQGGDEVQLSVFRDRKKEWWLVYELEYTPIARKALDLRELVRFGLQRLHAPTFESLTDELSWERFF